MKLDNDIFKQNTQLTTVDISSNYLTKTPYFGNLIHLNRLDIQDNPLTDINNNDLAKLSTFTVVYTSQHEICECFVPPNISCSAADNRSPYLSCGRLLSDKALATMMWFIGINALAGNIFVLSWRKRGKKKASQKNKVQDLLLSNLAMSDLLMGVYMLLIASADVYFGDYFPMQSETWRTGITCRIAGALSLLSSEASVFFVTIISTDRFVCIKYPHISKTLKTRICYIAVTLTWLIAAVIGIVPSALSGINFKFYDNSHVCIGLPLSLIHLYSSTELTKKICPDTGSCYEVPLLITESGPLVSGLYFSSAIFLGLNCICYLAILACYIEVVRVVYKSSKRAGLNKEMKEQMRLTFKVAAIVATDFACWFPVIVLGILVQARVLTLPPSVYAWCVTFVLPINSAINPYLYTIAAIISFRRKQKIGDASTSHADSLQQRADGLASRQVHTVQTDD
ncbi:G-protein coupled receptor GRL101-like [Amphiura filiformis]|uniref:G-protein coupled receptor GRL101-like n=1 Tax=Amphiura filiformis TaxID=82378 RepID=UPI003B2257A3